MCKCFKTAVNFCIACALGISIAGSAMGPSGGSTAELPSKVLLANVSSSGVVESSGAVDALEPLRFDPSGYFYVVPSGEMRRVSLVTSTSST